MLKPNLFTALVMGTLLVGLAGCSSYGSKTNTRYYVQGTESLESLKEIGSYKAGTGKKGMSKIREQAIQEVALSLGARAGLAARAKVINEQLLAEKAQLEKVFNFNALLLEHNILPPVLLEGRNTLNLADDQTIRLADRSYKINKQARFVTTPPNWRQYIWLDFKRPERPDGTLLPRNEQEQAVWDKYINIGWQSGLEQADYIFANNLGQLKQDYEGMIRYRKLLAQNIVSPPYVARTRLGVTGDTSEIHIDDQVLRITALPQLQIDSSVWESVVAIEDPALGEIVSKLSKLPSNKLSAMTEITEPTGHWDPVVKKDRQL